MNSTKIIICTVLYTADHLCIVRSNASPTDYDEMKLMDEVFYKTHHMREWQRSLQHGHTVKSSQPGMHQFTYLKVKTS